MKIYPLLFTAILFTTGQAAPLPDYLVTQWKANLISKSPKAIQKYTQQSQKGDAKASAIIGYVYSMGINVKRNYPLARTFFNKAITKKSLAAMHGLILIDINTKKVNKQTLEIANQYATLSADGQALRGRLLLKQNYKAALKDLTAASKAGSGYADYEIAKIYKSNGKKDITKAIQFMKSASDKGVPSAMAEIGIDILYGYNMPKNTTDGMNYLQTAAIRGSKKAYYEFGKAVNDNPNVFKDKIKTARAYLKSCTVNNNQCRQTLGSLLLKSSNPKDQKSGMNWLRKAALKGSIKAAQEYSKYNLKNSKENINATDIAIARYAQMHNKISQQDTQKIIKRASQADYNKSSNILKKMQKG